MNLSAQFSVDFRCFLGLFPLCLSYRKSVQFTTSITIHMNILLFHMILCRIRIHIHIRMKHETWNRNIWDCDLCNNVGVKVLFGGVATFYLFIMWYACDQLPCSHSPCILYPLQITEQRDWLHNLAFHFSINTLVS